MAELHGQQCYPYDDNFKQVSEYAVNNNLVIEKDINKKVFKNNIIRGDENETRYI